MCFCDSPDKVPLPKIARGHVGFGKPMMKMSWKPTQRICIVVKITKREDEGKKTLEGGAAYLMTTKGAAANSEDISPTGTKREV